MRIWAPSSWILRRARRLAGCDAGAPITRLRVLPQRLEIHAAGKAPVHVVPRGWRALALLVLAPLFLVVIAGGRARLHLRVGGLPYALDALIHRRRFAALPARTTARELDFDRSAA